MTSTPNTMIRYIIRLIGMTLCIYGHNNIYIPPELLHNSKISYLHRCQFLTIIGLYLTLMTLSLLVISQTVEILIKREIKFIRTVTIFFISIILPIESIITLTFWILYFYDPKTILNETLIQTNSIKISHNLCLHLIPILLLFLEAFFMNFERDNLHVIILCFFSLAYYVFLRNVSLREKRWPYPFLDNRTELGRIGIFFALTLIGVVIYEMLMFVLARKKKIKEKSE